MYLLGMSNHCPPHRFSQAECWSLIQRCPEFARLAPASHDLLEQVLLGDSGIQYRHFAVDDVPALFGADAESLNRRFEREAPRLAGQALAGALDQAGLVANDLDALYVCTCTGYLCPGLSSHVAEQVGAGDGVELVDLAGQGCGAAIPLLRTASHRVRADRSMKVACVAVEICSAAFYIDDDPGVLVSLCLFADGASATIWGHEPPAGDRAAVRCDGFQSLHWPRHRSRLRFENAAGKLRNVLHRTVPVVAARAVRQLHQQAGHNGAAVRILAHPGGKRVLDALESELDTPTLAESRAVLRRHGNMSSPSLLFTLEEALADAQPGDRFWATAFGAGFTCGACRFTVE